MQIITYERVGEIGDPTDYIARIQHSYPGKKGAIVTEWHPVVFHGATAASVEAKAQAWWDAELAKEVKRQEARRAAGQRLAALRKATA